MHASAIHCKSILQARMGRWGFGTDFGASVGNPFVISISTSSWRDVSHLIGSPKRTIASTREKEFSMSEGWKITCQRTNFHFSSHHIFISKRLSSSSSSLYARNMYRWSSSLVVNSIQHWKRLPDIIDCCDFGEAQIFCYINNRPLSSNENLLTVVVFKQTKRWMSHYNLVFVNLWVIKALGWLQLYIKLDKILVAVAINNQDVSFCNYLNA